MQPGIIFKNHANATVVGDLHFGAGKDDLYFEAGSGTQSVTGSIDGGAGDDSLTLTGAAGTSDKLTGYVNNFETLIKDEAGRWDITGSISGFTSVQVRHGILGLQGNNSGYTGEMIINPYYNPDGSVDNSRAGGDATAMVISTAQSLPTNGTMTNNVYNYGVLRLDQTQPDGTYTDGEYLGQIVGTGRVEKTGQGTVKLNPTATEGNTYSGGTWIKEGTLEIAGYNALGADAATNTLTMGDTSTNGTLKIDTDTTLSATRGNVTLLAGGGTFDTNGNNMNIGSKVVGNGRLTKAGNGILTLTGTNTYSGGTLVTGGTLAVNGDAAMGAASGRLVMRGGTTLRMDDDVTSSRMVTLAGGPGSTVTIDTQANDGTFTGVVEGNGGLVKTGSGVLALYGTNVYTGGTTVAQGTLAINSDDSLGAAAARLTLDAGTTLRLDGTVSSHDRPIALNGAAGDQMTIDTQGNTGTFAGTVSGDSTLVVDNTYSSSGGVVALYGQNTNTGGTWVKNNTTVAIKNQTGLGTGDIYLGDAAKRGTLRADADFTLNDKQIYLNAGGGAVNTNGNNVTLAENTVVNSVANNPPEIGTNGEFHKTGAGILTVLGDQNYTGATFVDQGTFRLDAVDQANPSANTKGLVGTSAMTVARGARLEGQGLVGAANALTTNNGTIAPGLPRFANAFDSTDSEFVSLTLNGDYTATAGAVVEINTQLIDDTSQHGTLVINGVVDNASAVTGVRVIHRGGDGATTKEGIEIIRILGTANHAAEGQKFRLLSDFRTKDGKEAVVAGAYAYWMEDDADYDYAAGAEIPTQSGIFLRNAKNGDGTNVIHPGTPVYESYGLMLGNLTRLSTLEQRVGHRNWLGQYMSSGEGFASLWEKHFRSVETRGIWAQMENSRGEYRPKLGTGRSRYDLRYHRATLGIDAPVCMFGAGSGLIGGLNVNYLWGKSKTRDSVGDGKIDVEGYGAGATLTWYDQSGFYLDAQARYNAYESDIKSETMHTNSRLVDNNDGHGYAFSLEAGRIFNLTNTWSLTPQGQLSYAKAKFDKFTDSVNSVIVSDQAYESLEGRLGMAVNYECSFRSAGGKLRRVKAYGLGNYYHEFEGDSKVSVSTVKYKSKTNKDWLGVALGGSYNWSDDAYSVYAEVGGRSSTKKFGKEHELTANVGFRVAF